MSENQELWRRFQNGEYINLAEINPGQLKPEQISALDQVGRIVACLTDEIPPCLINRDLIRNSQNESSSR